MAHPNHAGRSYACGHHITDGSQIKGYLMASKGIDADPTHHDGCGTECGNFKNKLKTSRHPNFEDSSQHGPTKSHLEET